MPRKVDPSELSDATRQILSRIGDPAVDLNNLWVVPASECEALLREAYGKYDLESLPVPEVASSPRATHVWRQALGLLFESLRTSVNRWLRPRNRSSDDG
jgi:hypothetical protein